MTYTSDATPIKYMSDGPAYPGEDAHTAMGQNTTDSLAGHMLNRPVQGVSPGTFSQPGEPTADAHPMAAEQPGHGFQDEPLDQAERAAQHTARNAARNAAQDTQGDDQGQAFPLSHAEVASAARQALRGGVA